MNLSYLTGCRFKIYFFFVCEAQLYLLFQLVLIHIQMENIWFSEERRFVFMDFRISFSSFYFVLFNFFVRCAYTSSTAHRPKTEKRCGPRDAHNHFTCHYTDCYCGRRHHYCFMCVFHDYNLSLPITLCTSLHT